MGSRSRRARQQRPGRLANRHGCLAGQGKSPNRPKLVLPDPAFKLAPRVNIQAALRNVTKQGQELLVRRWCERQTSAASRPRCARRPLEAQSLDALGQSCSRRSGAAPSHCGDRCRLRSPIGRYVDIEVRKRRSSCRDQRSVPGNKQFGSGPFRVFVRRRHPQTVERHRKLTI